MDPKRYEKRIFKATKAALKEGVLLSEIARQLTPLIGRSRLYAWVDKWRKEGKL